jgi:hypothetical protein
LRSPDFASTYKEYASARRSSRASPLNLFEQTAKQPFQPVFHDLNALNGLNRGFLAALSLVQRRHHFLRKQVEGHFAGFTGYTRNRESADEVPHI